MPRDGVYLLIQGVGKNPRGILTVGHPPKGHNLDYCVTRLTWFSRVRFDFISSLASQAIRISSLL